MRSLWWRISNILTGDLEYYWDFVEKQCNMLEIVLLNCYICVDKKVEKKS